MWINIAPLRYRISNVSLQKATATAKNVF